MVHFHLLNDMTTKHETEEAFGGMEEDSYIHHNESAIAEVFHLIDNTLGTKELEALGKKLVDISPAEVVNINCMLGEDFIRRVLSGNDLRFSYEKAAVVDTSKPMTANNLSEVLEFIFHSTINFLYCRWSEVNKLVRPTGKSLRSTTVCDLVHFKDSWYVVTYVGFKKIAI